MRAPLSCASRAPGPRADPTLNERRVDAALTPRSLHIHADEVLPRAAPRGAPLLLHVDWVFGERRRSRWREARGRPRHGGGLRARRAGRERAARAPTRPPE